VKFPWSVLCLAGCCILVVCVSACSRFCERERGGSCDSSPRADNDILVYGLIIKKPDVSVGRIAISSNEAVVRMSVQVANDRATRVMLKIGATDPLQIVSVDVRYANGTEKRSLFTLTSEGRQKETYVALYPGSSDMEPYASYEFSSLVTVPIHEAPISSVEVSAALQITAYSAGSSDASRSTIWLHGSSDNCNRAPAVSQ